MGPPAITRQRRPFLAPVWVVLLAAVAVACIAFALHHAATTTMVVLAISGDKQPGTIDDPPISEEGEQRAQRLAQMFGAAGTAGRLDAVYASNARRAQQTVAPLVERLHLSPVLYGPQDAQGAAAGLLHLHAGQNVLVVGSAADVAAFLRELVGIAPAAAADEDPDLLYIVSLPTFGPARLLRLKY
ncbi:MAG: phosphoglycerate mutase family protein [Steroidobacteraceae bacterium]